MVEIRKIRTALIGSFTRFRQQKI